MNAVDSRRAVRDRPRQRGRRWQERLEIKRRHPQLHSEWECDLAGVLARLGENDRALAELEKAYQERLFDLLFLRVSPEFDGLRGDPRFQDLVRRIGLPR